MAKIQVKKGSNWFNLAEKYKVSPQALMRRNGDVKRLQAGQFLDVPTTGQNQAAAWQQARQAANTWVDDAGLRPLANSLGNLGRKAFGNASFQNSIVGQTFAGLGGRVPTQGRIPGMGDVQRVGNSGGPNVRAQGIPYWSPAAQYVPSRLKGYVPGTNFNNLYGFNVGAVPENVINAMSPTQLPDTYFNSFVPTATHTAAMLAAGKRPVRIAASDQWMLGITDADLQAGGYTKEPWGGWVDNTASQQAQETGGSGGAGYGSGGTGAGFGGGWGSVSGGTVPRGRGITQTGRTYNAGIGPVSWRV